MKKPYLHVVVIILKSNRVKITTRFKRPHEINTETSDKGGINSGKYTCKVGLGQIRHNHFYSGQTVRLPFSEN